MMGILGRSNGNGPSHASAEVVANVAICLIHQANYLLDRQLEPLEKAFSSGGRPARADDPRSAAGPGTAAEEAEEGRTGGEAMKVPQTTFYAKSTGVEIGPYEKRGEGRPAEGRLVLRFFRMEGGAAAIRFIAEPAEAFDLHLKINRTFREGGRESLVHRFEGPEGEVLTRLVVERYGEAERPGYALAIQRGEDKINVPMSAERFLFAADFLRHLALHQSWVEVASS
jgi:hypothetical protein